MAPRRKGRKRRNSEEWSEDWDEEGSKRSSPFKVSRKEIRGPNGGKRQVLYTWNSNFQEYKERIRTQCKLLAYLLYHSVSENEKDQAFVREIIKDLNEDKYLTEEAKNFMNYIRNHPNVLNETTSMDLSMTLNKSSSSPRKRQRVKQESDAQSTNQLTDEESSRSPVAGGSSDQEGSYSPPTPLSAENETIPLSSLLPLATTEKDEMEPLYVNTDALSDVLQASGSTNVINGYSTAVILLTLYRKRLYSFDTLVSQLVHNSDPFLHTQWHQYPYTQRPFLPLHDYVPCEGLTTDMEQETMHRMLFTARSSAPSSSPSLPSNLQSSPLAEESLFQHVQFGRDVMIKDTWGIDCYTRHSIEILLQLLGWESSLVTTFVRTVLAPTINQQTPTTAFDMRNTLFSLLDKNEVYVEGAIALLQFYLDLGPGYLRIHPKGKGILCCNPQGIPANLSIAPYLGEVYPPWKWFEKQEAVKKAIKEFKLEDVLPDFYNILLERTTDSESGYDCLFIDPVYKGNFSSRLSHSCEPNCATTPITIGKRALIALSSVKPIQLGEELCFDYSCVSESNKEFQKAICLCGSPQCRGSFVSYADGKSFNQVISLAYHFLRRTRVLYEASTLPLTSDDILKLNQVGIRSSVLAGCPPWLVKYVSLTLDFIQFELKALPDVLLHMPLVVPYTKTTALIESKGVYASRLQNLVISLDKVRYFLSKQPEDYQQQTLFKSLEENEIMDFLWNGPQSVMKRLFRSYFTSPICPGASAEEYQRMVEWNMKYTTIHTQSMEEVRALMIELRNLLWTLKGPNEYKHKAAGDVLTFYIHTHVYFTPNEYKQIHSPEAIVRGCDISCSAEKLIRLVHRSLDRTLSNSTIPNHVRQLIEQVTEERKRGLKKEDEREGIAFVTEQQPTLYEEVWNRMTVEEQLFYSNAKVYSHSKNYCTSFIWGQLNNWYKQTIDNPSASLSAERRGCLSLPDIECVYDATFKYSEATRVQFFKFLFENPTSMWKLEYGWGFRNTQHVYGTPMFDCVLGHHNHFEEFLNDISLEIHTSYKRYRHSKRSNGLSALELLNVGYSEFPMFKD